MIRGNIKEFENTLECRVSAYPMMTDVGYCKLASDDFNRTDAQKSDLSIIQRHFDTLALDPYSYKQDVGFNDEVVEEARKFQPVPNEILSNNLITSLVLHDFKNSPLHEYASTIPMEVGIHFIRMKATVDAPGISVPNRLHKDGEPCTWIHLINRDGVSGGENIITDNTKTNILCNEAMLKPLDSIGIVDDLVWHQVKPVHVDGHGKVGFRDVILIDFTPMFAVPNNPS